VDIQNLKLFVEVARQGGFAAAARAHALDPSSVSRSIAALEAELGLRLFQRSTRKLALTEAGHLYLGRVAPLVDELGHAREEAAAASAGVAGTLRLTTSVAFGYQKLAALLPKFRALHPQLKLEVLMTDSNLHLVNDRIDLAIRSGARFEGDMVCTQLLTTRYRVCASPAYVAQHGLPGSPQEAPQESPQQSPQEPPQNMARHACVLLALPGHQSEWQFKDARGRVLSVPVHGSLVVSNPLVQWRCALQGLGPALLVDWLADEALASGELVDLFPHHQVSATRFDTGIWLLYPSRQFLPRKVRVMIDFLKQQLGGGAQTPPEP
jgi:DNA-binding transcriptional LysR family regulator